MLCATQRSRPAAAAGQGCAASAGAAVTPNVCKHVLADERELDYAALLGWRWWGVFGSAAIVWKSRVQVEV